MNKEVAGEVVGRYADIKRTEMGFYVRSDLEYK